MEPYISVHHLPIDFQKLEADNRNSEYSVANECLQCLELQTRKNGSNWSDLTFKFVSLTKQYPISIEGEQAWLDFVNEILKPQEDSVSFPKTASEYKHQCLEVGLEVICNFDLY